MKPKLKTARSRASVKAFLGRVRDKARRQDCLTISRIMKQATKSQPRMWGPSIVGFGDAHLKYDSGRELDWFLTGFSPRKQDLTLYVMSGFSRHGALMRKLGKHKTGKSCLYIKRLADIDLRVLKQLVQQSVKPARMRG